MTQLQIILIATLAAAGVALVGLLLIRGEKRQEQGLLASPDEAEDAAGSQDPVEKLSETLQALNRLSEIWDEENVPLPTSAPEGSPAEKDLSTDAGPASEDVVPPTQEVVAAPTTEGAVAPKDLRMMVGEAFSPSAPVIRRDLFAGRTQQMEDLVDTVYERGQHAVIYGERGVGKTSIATVMSRVFDGHETHLGVRVNCDSSDTYGQLWRKVFEQIEAQAPTMFDPIDHGAASRLLEEVRAQDEIVPNDVRRVLAALAATKECLIFIDEFDTLRDETASRLFADTIKMLSDQLVPATLVLIGVADDLDELIKEHGSVRRALVRIHVPRMSDEELRQVVEQGLALLNMECSSPALDLITQISQGFPHYTHLLAQAAARAAIDSDRTLIELTDVANAIDRVGDRFPHVRGEEGDADEDHLWRGPG